MPAAKLPACLNCLGHSLVKPGSTAYFPLITFCAQAQDSWGLAENS